MNKIDVCFSPDLLHLYEFSDRIAIVVDILRATSCITAGIGSGIESITPVATLEECRALQKKGYIAGGERDGKQEEGFDMGNSPFSYMDPKLKGQKVAMTTTNGTFAINEATSASQVLIGSFLNFSALIEYLKTQHQDLMVICAGWKGKYSLEDSLFAGALVEGLKGNYQSEDDSGMASEILFRNAKRDPLAFISGSSHVNRLKGIASNKDVEFCFTADHFNVVPVLRGNVLVSMDKIADDAQ